MDLRIAMVTFDAVDPRSLAEWWARALGGEIVMDQDGHFVEVSTATGLELGFQWVAEPTEGKNKIHLDLDSPNPDDQIQQLKAVGARVLRRHETPDFSWVVLADPEGNQFCVSAQADYGR
jgi:predicted enzyme related to lactoylglutathione lyase